MDINWLEDFVCLARVGNFTRAAAERHVTQSAFSRRIQSLESWLGVSLIHRDSYPATLSAAGEEFLPVARAMLIQLLRTRDELRASAKADGLSYRFAAPHSISLHVLAEKIHALANAFPGVATRVLSDNLHMCCQNLTEGLCDFLVCYRHPQVALTLDEARYTRQDFAQVRLLPVAAPGVDGRVLWNLSEPSEKEIPFLAYAGGAFLGAVVNYLLKQRAPPLRIQHVDDFADALRRLALLGAGLAFLPEHSVRADLQAGRLMHAGGRGWTTALTLCAYTDLEQLDATGQKIWQQLAQS